MLGTSGVVAREKVGLMTRYLTRDAAAVAAAVLGPLALAAVLLPARGSWPNTNVALLLVAAVVAVACLGNRLAVADAGYFNRIVASAALTQRAGTPYDVTEHVRSSSSTFST
jgi:hypothetical protein